MSEFLILPVNDFNLDDPRLEYDNVIGIPEVFTSSFSHRKPYDIKYGSRYSAKSWTEAIRQLVYCTGPNYYRGVFARMTQKAARQSQFQLFQDTMKRHPALGAQFKVRDTDMKITHRKTGNYLLGGSFEDADALMSVPDITHFWSEEPINRKRSLTRDQFLSIAGTMRNDKGIVPQFSMTFNPIHKSAFVHEDFFVKKMYDAHIIKANYDDNPWCPADRIKFLQNMKRNHPDRFEIEGRGNFGQVLTGFEYYGMFSKGTHCRPRKLVQLPAHITFDFNVVPYMSAVVNLMWYDTELDLLIIHAVKEYTLKPPYSTIKSTCDAILRDWEGHIKANGCFIYGDPEANKRTVIAEARDLKKNIIKHMRGYANAGNMRIAKSARRHLTTNNRIGRFDLFQKLFGNELPVLYLIDPNECPLLVEDYENVLIDPNGGKAKPKVTEKGVKFEKHGHLSDAQDYFIGWNMNYQFKL